MTVSDHATTKERSAPPLFEARHIWAAMNVQERLTPVRDASSDQTVALGQDDRDAQARLAHWRTQEALDGAPLSDPTVIYDCSEAAILTILGQPDALLVERGAKAAEWSERLNDAWSRGSYILTNAETPVLEDLRRTQATCPFAGLVQPLTAWAIDALLSTAIRLANDRANTPFAPMRVTELFASSLVSRLDSLCRRMGVVELHASRLSGELTGDSAEERFQSFATRLLDPGTSRTIMRRSPVLARLSFTVADNWLRAAEAFLTHLTSDWPAIHASFDFDRDDELREIQTTGDLHNGGRAVLCLGFATGRWLVYKPRSVEVEAQFQHLLDRLCSIPGFPELRRLTVVAKQDHGWVEYFGASDCASDELPLLYRRYGALLAVMRMLAATDCHFQNVVAAGPEPAVLDLEALFHAFPSSALDLLGPAEQASLEETDGSVLTVGLLPVRRWSNASERSVDVSGLGAREDEWASAKKAHWLNEYTDEMREEIRRSSPIARAEPSTRGDALYPHVGDVATGFEQADRALLKNKDEFLSDAGPLSAFARLETRSVLRPTGQYAYLLQSATHPSFLADAARLDARFDQLIAAESSLAMPKALIDSERRQLWQLDVPIFHAHPGTRDVSSADVVVTGYLSETGLDRARRRIEGMSEADLERQLWLIRLSIATWAINRRNVSEGEAKARLPLSFASCEDEADAARLIAGRLHEIAHRRGGEANWIGAQYRPVDDTWVVDAITANLFDGLAGIIFFLAYAADATGDSTCLDLAMEAHRTFTRKIERTLATPDAELITGFSGLGGWIHLLTHLSALWRDDALLQQATQLVPLIAAGLPDAHSVDVVSGAAGAIRPLLTLYQRSGAVGAMECAIACGDSILGAAIPQPIGWGWLSAAGPEPLAGFAHGAAGVSWSLLKLHAATELPRFLDGALAGIAYERSLFSPDDKNWLDLRMPANSAGASFGPSAYFWCHGSVGIGLARIDNVDAYCDAQTEAEIEAAVQTTARHGFRPDHSLCHGYGGSAELLMLAEEAGIPTPPRPAQSWGAAMLESIRAIGLRTGCPLGIEVPGLMMGTAGVGYALLRLCDPARIPSVLLMEPPR